MKIIKKLRSNMKADIIGGLIFLILIFAIVVYIIGYNIFTDAFKKEYTSVTHHMADSAAAIVNGDHIDQYLAGEEQEEYSAAKRRMDVTCQRMNVSLIYVIKVDTSDYGSFESVFNSVNNSVDDSEYTEWEVGHKRNTTNDEYRDKYKAIYEQMSDCETVFRTDPGDGSHPHMTTMVPVNNSEGEVTALLCIQRPIREMVEAIMPYLIMIFIGVALIEILVCVLATRFLNKSIITPVEKVSKEASRFAKENVKSEPLGEISRYEVLMNLAGSIDFMETEMTRYIENMTAVTAERERIGAEISIAAQIQNDALPAVFPPFPDREEFDIYASMDPARGVGGDFYNFFFIDDDHLALVIADVSGKGIPGALFMMVTNILVTERTKMGGTPAEILGFVNEQHCEHNKAEMFVTVWLGILEVSTGHLIYANAGHEDHAVYRNNKSFEIVKEKHGFVVGGMEGIRYKDYEMQLNKGDKLFLYTDGVPEATDKDGNMFGTGRMEDALNMEPAAGTEQILRNVRKSVDEFVGDAEPFDDLTMLCLEYRGPELKAGCTDNEIRG